MNRVKFFTRYQAAPRSSLPDMKRVKSFAGQEAREVFHLFIRK
jgi:hypothetical protein